MKRILVVGASGVIGANLCRALRDDFVVYGTYRAHCAKIDRVPFIKFPLEDLNQIENFLDKMEPDVVVYAAGERDEAVCEKNADYARFVNAVVPAAVAGMSQARGFRFIFLSTSKIFSGNEGNYDEEDLPQPKSIYGGTKKEGEDLLAPFRNIFVLRLGTVFGMSPFGKNDVFTEMWTGFDHGKKRSLINDEWRSFVSAAEVSRAIRSVIEADEENAGIYHVGGVEKDSYYTFGSQFLDVFGMSQNLAAPIDGEHLTEKGWSAESRGKDLSLNPSRFAKTFKVRPKATQEMLLELRDTLRRGEQ